MLYLEVAVASPIVECLTYLPPDPCPVDLRPGLRLLVPLGPRLLTGYLLAMGDSPPSGDYTLRPAADILDSEPLFPAVMIPFFRWLAGYYQYPLGEIIRAALPGGLNCQSGRRVLLTESGRSFLSKLPESDLAAGDWRAVLLERGALSIAATRKLWCRRADGNLLRRWQSEGLVEIRLEVCRDRVRDKRELCVRALSQQQAEVSLKASERKTFDLVLEQAAAAERPWVSRRDLNRVYAGAGRVLGALRDKGLLSMEERRVYRTPFGERPPFYAKPEFLSSDQQRVMAELIPALRAGSFRTYLLHGVTGSGKTEIYLRAAEEALRLGRDVLILVPEIALAAQIEGNFLARFGERIALLHSGLSAGERLDQWKRVAAGAAHVVIGARSALFAPLSNLGLIVVDEEHDGAYKQEDGFCYQGRDAAIMRAKMAGAVVILGSATPSVISYNHARNGKYSLLRMPSRVADRQLPTVEIIDLRGVKTTSGRPPMFTNQLIRAVRENFKSGGQSLIFLNRRGYANMMLCPECGYILQCDNCQVSLTLHRKQRQLICHYCGSRRKSAALCPKCQAVDLLEVGFGTERVEAELRKIMPQARIARLDRDTALDRRRYIKVLREVHQGGIDILVGTQMIAKGHHFPGVTLVGVIWADASLSLPDYRAAERTFQLLTQVFGRAGRGERPGRVLVQTHHPDHYSILNSRDNDYEAMFNSELAMRRTLQYPPFSRLINLRFSGEREDKVRQAVTLMAEAVKPYCRKGLAMLGPAPSPLARLRGRYRWQLLLKGEAGALHVASAFLQQRARKAGFPGGVKMTVDVDPENML